MSKSENEAIAILEAAARLPGGASIGDLMGTPGLLGASRRTVQRRVQGLLEQGRLLAVGQGPSRRYVSRSVEDLGESSQPDDGQLPLGEDSRAIRAAVNNALVNRQPVGYQARFLDDYEPNETTYLPPATRARLAKLGKVGVSELPAGTYTRQLMDRLLIDLSWNSSRLEGNTYTLLETQRLLNLGEMVEGKAAEDAQMILNHKGAIELLCDPGDEVRFNRYTLCSFHALLADNLLSDPAACGRVRSRGVGISGTVFQPLDNPHELEERLQQVLDKGSAILDPFEQAFFGMVHLPYLQPFEDVNKRVSRLMANVPLLRHNLCPLSFIDVPQAEYISGLLGVYELNKVELLRDVFLWAYERSAARYGAVRQSLGEPDLFRLRYREQIGSIIRNIVRGCLPKPAALTITDGYAGDNLPGEDQARFKEVIEIELRSLHENNIARYRLRPSEFATWHEAW